MKTLEIKNLVVETQDKKVLKGLDFCIQKGEVIALLGPNGSGKSSLVKVISGDPRYKVKKGEIKFNNKNILNLSMEKRVELGIVIAHQNAPVIKGLFFNDYLNKIARTKKYFKDEKLLKRELNKGFSGGEKKIAELMQITALKPKLVILDEIDSGLDLKKIKQVAEIIKEYFIKKNVSVLIITHNGEILDLLKPNKANIIVDGRMVGRDENHKNVLKTIKKYGYEKCKKCTKFLPTR